MKSLSDWRYVFYSAPGSGQFFYFALRKRYKYYLVALVGLVVEASALTAADLGFDSRLRCGDFSWLSHTSDLQISTPVATLPGVWRYRVRAETGWPGVSILWLDEVESLICNFYLIARACKTVSADPSLRYAGWDVMQQNKHQKTLVVRASASRREGRWGGHGDWTPYSSVKSF